MATFKEQYDSIGFSFESERNRQQQALVKRAEIRKQKHERTKRIKLMYQGEQLAKASRELGSGLQA